MSAPPRSPSLAPDPQRDLAVLPAVLRAWAREVPEVGHYLLQHIHDGLPLGRVLARIAIDIDEEQVFERVQGHREEAASHCGGFWPEGACWALATGRRGTSDGHEVPVCNDCREREFWTQTDWRTGKIK